LTPRVYALDGKVPVIHSTAFVHPTAVLIGDVIVGPHCYIGPLASLRGDFGRIRIGPGANVQDSCVLHTFPDEAVLIEEDGHIGHGAILHGCRIGRNALIGMNSAIMDRVEVGEDSIVGAQSLVNAGVVIPPRSLFAGAPARLIRELAQADIDRKHRGTVYYQELAQRCLAGMIECAPLAEPEAGRRVD
jgi:phenylacetic acid degradation protein